MSESLLGSGQPQNEQASPQGAPPQQGLGGSSPDASQQPASGQSSAGDAKPVSFDDNWRAYIAGENKDALTELSRIKTPQDLASQLLHQKKELSKRAASGAFPENGSDEDKAAWRQANGVPAEPSLDAYGVKMPEGYNVDPIEKGMIDEYLGVMADKNVPSSIVQETMDYWFRAQEANRQQMLAYNNEVHENWDAEVRQELGKDYKPLIDAGDAYLRQTIKDDAAIHDLLTAQLPGGGLLGKHPAFIKMVTDLALQNGFGDRLEANALEAGGRSLAEQHAEIERWMISDPQKYNSKATQDRLEKIIALRIKSGEIDQFGNDTRKRS